MAEKSTPPADRLLASVELPATDYFSLPAITDNNTALLVRLALYDDTPLNVREEGSIDLKMGGVARRYTMDATYRGEKLIVYVIEPDAVPSSAQALVWMGGLSHSRSHPGPEDLRTIAGYARSREASRSCT
jgi:hypothetical protein